jgi:hypothetical protein
MRRSEMEATKPETAKLRDAASTFARAIDVRSRTHAHPYGAVATAVGVGYVLGGGLFTRLTARLLKLGARLGADLAVVPLLVKAVESLGAAQEPRAAPEASRPSPTARAALPS